MAEDHIRYDVLTQDALRGVVRKVLSEVAKAGLPGDHHFFISFATRAPGVRISKKLLDQYQEEMTIVVQNQFWDLKTSETGFEIGLSFDGVSETLSIPFSALKGFFDPSVQFGLQFDVTNSGSSAKAPASAGTPSLSDGATGKDVGSGDTARNAEAGAVPDKTGGKTSSADDPEKQGEKVVSLDSFRKKT
ncbi:MAG TPA: hypothetical protein ENJ90_12555 [Devosia sp.]|nr:hypothetical protein [Devosia sp.]